MNDCVLDTHILVEVLSAYKPLSPLAPFARNKVLSDAQTKVINDIVRLDGSGALIATSAISIIEILNQFDLISEGGVKFNINKFYSFIEQPPQWFIIEDMTLDTGNYLIKVPKHDRKGNKIELADSIHVATALQRGPQTKLLTNDGRLNDLPLTNLDISIIV